MRKTANLPADEGHTVWEPDGDFDRRERLAAVLNGNPIPVAYRLNYVANFYVGPLVKNMEQAFGLSQISDVSGRPKTSISKAVRQLLNKKLIVRSADVRDGRRLVLHLTDAGRKIYKKILASFVAREADMMACLDHNERQTILGLLDKVIDNSANWAKPY